MDFTYLKMIQKVSIKILIKSIKIGVWLWVAMLQQLGAQSLPKDSIPPKMNLDATYDRPFLGTGKFPVALGGYAEANSQLMQTDGISDGWSFQMRRLTLFVASEIGERVRFLSEIEFEEGTKEINIEFAAVDYAFHPLFNLRGGIILNPIGMFNQNHDGPKWEFTDRPLVSTEMLPATWSNVGFGLHGKWFRRKWAIAYEAYVSNGFDEQIIDNDRMQLFLPATKLKRDRFEESSNGEPMWTGKVAVKRRNWGEVGLSYMGGVYNRAIQEGEQVWPKRRVHAMAIDFQSTLPFIGTGIVGEAVWVTAELPSGISPQVAQQQWGAFIDLVQPLYQGKMLGWKKAVLNAAIRLEYVDMHRGVFKETGGSIGDETQGASLGLGFRPNSQGVIRLNYTRRRQVDFMGNPPAQIGIWQLGISSYF